MPLVDFLVLDGSVTGDQRGRAWAVRFDDALATNTCLLQPEGWVLSGDWRSLQARHAPFALAQDFVQTLMRLRPQRVVFESLSGATADLARLSLAIGLPTLVRRSTEPWQAVGEHGQRWLQALLERITVINADPPLPAAPSGTPDGPAWDYGLYALGMRDLDLLLRMQSPDVRHLVGCQRVLDVGCGTGAMLEALARAGIGACGVDRNPQSTRFAASLGLTVHTQDALAYLEQHPAQFDGLYCSHFVEHLPMPMVEQLIALCARALVPGGVAVLSFPDPESIRSQLLGFWRDPEHVRFYHPQLIASVAAVHGLALEHNSQNLPGRRVGPFSLQAPAMPAMAPGSAPTLWQRIAQRLGLAQPGLLEALQHQIDHQQKLIDQLWQVNQTWAWEDNAVLKFRKRAA
jgi:O-antigen chain-terminating methyltransferase